MPISSISSYLPTMQEFVTHWTAVNAAISPAVLTLPGSYAVATLATDRTALESAILNVETAINALQNAANDRDIKKDGIRPRLAQFRGLVIAQIGTSNYRKSLPKMPRTDLGEGKYLQPFADMQTLWGQINAAPPAGFTAPLTLPGPFLVAAFTTELTALRTAYALWSQRKIEASNVRATRDALLGPARTRLQQYRNAVIGVLPAGHALLNSIPAYSPPPGSTPDPVNLSGTWNETTDMAELVWSASVDPNLEKYNIRYHPGPRYKAAEEQSVDFVNPPDTELATVYGLPAPGSVAWFKVYVTTSTSNEKGSNAVKITRV